MFAAPDLNVPLHPHADLYCEVMDQDGVIISCVEQLEVDLPREYAAYGPAHCIVGVGERICARKKTVALLLIELNLPFMMVMLVLNCN